MAESLLARYLLCDGAPHHHFADPVAYDPEYAQRFWRVLLQADRVFKHFRTGFLGKASPVHLFWGSFDLAVTRFSGRSAPPHPGGVPALPDPVTREAYSHEVSSAGFWPGGGLTDYAAFYSYAYPTPQAYSHQKVRPAEAFFHAEAGEFILPTTPCARRPIPIRLCSISCKAPTTPRLRQAIGTGKRSNASSACRASRVRTINDRVTRHCAL